MDRRKDLKASFWGGLRSMGDMMLLNWLWFFTALPIVTIGPATCALYSVSLKLVRREHAHTVKDFFRAFRDNFRPGLVLGLMALVLAVLAGGDWLFALEQTGPLHTLYMALAVFILAVLLTFVCYAFALQAMFENPLKQQIKNAFTLAFLSPGKTLMMWLISIFPWAALIVLPKVVIAMLGFLYLIFGFSGPVWLNCRILRDVFDKVNGGPVRPETENGEEE